MIHKFHGLALAAGSVASNFHFESLAETPAPLAAGRIWINSTDRTFNFSTLNAGGAVVVNSFSSLSDLQAAVATLTAAIEAEATRATAAEQAEITARAAAITAVNSALATEISDRTTAVSGEAAARIQGDADEAAARTTAIATAASTASDADATESAARLAGDAAANGRIDGLQTELNATQAGAGLDADGAYTAPAGSALLSTALSLKEATEKLDTALVAETARATGVEGGLASSIANVEQASIDRDTALEATIQSWVTTQIALDNTTDEGRVAAEAALRIAKDDSLQAELDATQAAVGLDTAGNLIPITGTNYLNTATTVFGGAFILDTELKRVDDGLATEISTRAAAITTLTTGLSTEVSDRAAAVAAVQGELNTTQAGAGLETTGAYAAPTTSNYLGLAVSLKDADSVLDAALKSVSDRVGAVETVAVPNLQSQIDAEVARATAAETAAASGSSAAVEAVATNLATEITNRTSGDASLQSAITAEETRAMGVEGGLQTQITAIVAASGEGAAALKTELNAKRFQYQSASPALTHTVTHGMATPFYSLEVRVQGGDGVWRNDIVPVEDAADNNSFTITLTESSNVRASGQANAALV